MMLALLAAACKETNGPRDPIVSELQCAQPNGQFSRCNLTLSQAGGFQVTLNSVVTCEAHGNKVQLTKPIEVELTADACYEPAGRAWTYPGPYEAGTEIDIEIESPRLRLPSELRVTGAYPSWTIDFEDGGDKDFDDLQLVVEALPQ